MEWELKETKTIKGDSGVVFDEKQCIHIRIFQNLQVPSPFCLEWIINFLQITFIGCVLKGIVLASNSTQLKYISNCVCYD